MRKGVCWMGLAHGVWYALQPIICPALLIAITVAELSPSRGDTIVAVCAESLPQTTPSEPCSGRAFSPTATPRSFIPKAVLLQQSGAPLRYAGCGSPPSLTML